MIQVVVINNRNLKLCYIYIIIDNICIKCSKLYYIYIITLYITIYVIKYMYIIHI